MENIYVYLSNIILLFVKEYKSKLLKKWDSVKELRKYLDLFTAYVSKTNNACDAEQDSYDVAILFTGRGDDLKDVIKGRAGV